jgi:hypothetical protein
MLLAGALSLSAFAQSGKTNALPEIQGLNFPVTAGVISGQFVLTNGCLFQPDQRTEVGEGGKAIFRFAITNAGDYVIYGIADAPGPESNSFFLNIDGPPEDPLMIWDVDETAGFEERAVSWRGDGTDSSDQYHPKVFKLTAGVHQLILHGREPDTRLKTISIRPAKPK